MSSILDDLEQAIRDARSAANEITAEKYGERLRHLETKYRDLETRLRPILNLIEGRRA